MSLSSCDRRYSSSDLSSRDQRNRVHHAPHQVTLGEIGGRLVHFQSDVGSSSSSSDSGFPSPSQTLRSTGTRIQSRNEDPLAYFIDHGGVVYYRVALPSPSSSSSARTISPPTHDISVEGDADAHADDARGNDSSGYVWRFLEWFLLRRCRWMWSRVAGISTRVGTGAEMTLMRTVSCSWHPFLSRFAVSSSEGESAFLCSLCTENPPVSVTAQDDRDPADAVVRLATKSTASEAQASSETTTMFALRHDAMQRCSCVAWKPLSGTVVAVGTENGICVWTSSVVPEGGLPATVWQGKISSREDLVERISCEFWNSLGHAPITDICWSPDGRFLASVSHADSRAFLWDYSTLEGQPQILEAAGSNPSLWPGRGCCVVRFSPNGEFLFVGCMNGDIRVWDTMTWTCTTWTHHQNPIHSCCWSPDSKICIFGARNEHTLSLLEFDALGRSYCSSLDIWSLYDSRNNSPLHLRQESVPIRHVDWDETGSRLAVLFDVPSNAGDLNSKEIHVGAEVQIYATTVSPTFDISFIGTILARSDYGKALRVVFRPGFERGALLTTCWDDGYLTFCPMYFLHPRDSSSLSSSSTPKTSRKGKSVRYGNIAMLEKSGNDV